MSDLAKRLRKLSSIVHGDEACVTCSEAADEIERLHAENENLKKKLQYWSTGRCQCISSQLDDIVTDSIDRHEEHL